MTFVVFAAPMFSTAASQMIEAAVSLSGVRVAVVSQEPLERLASHIAARLTGHYRIDSITDAGQLETAVRALASRHGPIYRCFGAYEQLQVPLAIVREKLGVQGLSSAAATNFRDKARMKDVLRSAGVPVARHRLIGSVEQAEAFAREVGFPIVIKPPAGAGAIATQRCEDRDALTRFLTRYPPTPGDPMLAEEFLHGSEHSIETVSVAGHTLWHSITNYYPTPLEVLENPWIQWSVLLPREVDAPAHDDIRLVAARAPRCIGHGYGRLALRVVPARGW
jgi:biotin carboxylase